MRRVAVWLLLVALIPLAGAQAPGADAQEIANGTVTKGKSLVGQAVDGLQGAAQGVGNAASTAGQGLGDAFGAVGRFLGAVGSAMATGLIQGTTWTQKALATVGELASRGVMQGATGAISGVTVGAVLLGDAFSGVMATTAALVAAAASVVASLVAALYALYGDFVAQLRPRAISKPVYEAIVVTSAAGTLAAASYGLWALARRFAWVASLGGLGLFSRIEDDEVLKHPLRGQVFQVIQAQPGIHASELTRRVGAGWGTIVHHLDKLERAKLVAVRKVNNQKCYFESGGKVSRADMQVASAVRSDSANQIASFVANHPMTSQKLMASELGLSAALTSFHVKKLVALGVLDKVRQGKSTLLTTTDALRRVMAGDAPEAAQPALVTVPA